MSKTIFYLGSKWWQGNEVHAALESLSDVVKCDAHSAAVTQFIIDVVEQSLSINNSLPAFAGKTFYLGHNKVVNVNAKGVLSLEEDEALIRDIGDGIVAREIEHKLIPFGMGADDAATMLKLHELGQAKSEKLFAAVLDWTYVGNARATPPTVTRQKRTVVSSEKISDEDREIVLRNIRDGVRADLQPSTGEVEEGHEYSIVTGLVGGDDNKKRGRARAIYAEVFGIDDAAARKILHPNARKKLRKNQQDLQEFFADQKTKLKQYYGG